MVVPQWTLSDQEIGWKNSWKEHRLRADDDPLAIKEMPFAKQRKFHDY
jgi:hypothetical protein